MVKQQKHYDARIHEKRLTLYKLSHSYHLSPLSSVPEGSLGQGGQQATEHAEMAWGAPDGVPGFLPGRFVKMLRTVDHFLNKLGDTVKNSADKTGDMIEIGKLNAIISSKQAAISIIKQKIGFYYCEHFGAGEEYPPEVTERGIAPQTEYELLNAWDFLDTAPLHIDGSWSYFCAGVQTTQGKQTLLARENPKGNSEVLLTLPIAGAYISYVENSLQ